MRADTDNQELQDAIEGLRDLAERLMEQQLLTNDAIEGLMNRPPPSPIRFPMPVPVPHTPVVQPPPPPMRIERPLSAIEIPATIQMPIPEPYQPSYADVLTNIANALQEIVELGNRPPEGETQPPQAPHEPEESSEGDISEVLSSTTGTTLRRDMFDRMRSGILGPHTVPSDESLRTALPGMILADAPSRRPDSSIALDPAPPFRPTVRRPVPRRVMRSPSPDWIRPRSVPLPDVARTLPPWQPPIQLRTVRRRRISVPESEFSDSAPSTEEIPVEPDHESKVTGTGTEAEEEAEEETEAETETETETETEIGEEKQEGGVRPSRDQRLADGPDIDMERAVRHARRQRQRGGYGFYGEPEPLVRIILTFHIASRLTSTGGDKASLDGPCRIHRTSSTCRQVLV